MSAVLDPADVHGAWAGLLEMEALLHGGRTWLRAGLLLAATGVPAAQWNPSVAVGPPQPGAADAVADALAEGATAVLVPEPLAGPWAPILQAAGLGPPEERRAIVRSTTVELGDDAGLAIEIVTAATLADHVRVQAAAYDDDPASLARWLAPFPTAPHVQLLTGRLKGEPVASAMMLHHVPSAQAAILGVGTIPAARDRGLGAAITRAALRAASDAGARTAFLEPTPAAGSLYERLGFTEIPGRLLWKRR